MDIQSRSMKMWQWVAATIVSTVTAGATIFTFLGNLIYTNAQGKALEGQVTQIEQREREDIGHIRDKLDEILQIIIKERRRD